MKRKSEYTGAQAYRRKDGKFGWRFFINGDIKARGTDYYETIEEAIDCAINVLTFTVSEQEARRRESLNADSDMLDTTLPHEVPRSSVCHWCRKGECGATHGECVHNNESRSK